MISTPQDLQDELQRLLIYAGSEKPSREKLASEIKELANKVSEAKEAGYTRGAVKLWCERFAVNFIPTALPSEPPAAVIRRLENDLTDRLYRAVMSWIKDYEKEAAIHIITR